MALDWVTKNVADITDPFGFRKRDRERKERERRDRIEAMFARFRDGPDLTRYHRERVQREQFHARRGLTRRRSGSSSPPPRRENPDKNPNSDIYLL